MGEQRIRAGVRSAVRRGLAARDVLVALAITILAMTLIGLDAGDPSPPPSMTHADVFDAPSK